MSPRPPGAVRPPAPRQVPTVSPTSAERFAARVRSRRRRRAGLAALGVLALAGLGWLALGSPWTSVQRIEVSGTQRIDTAAVAAAAGSEVGHALLLARTGEVRDRVLAEQPLALDVEVHRGWLSTLRIEVTERQPVAAVPVKGGFQLLDLDGVKIDTAKAPPEGLPRVEVRLGAEHVGTLQACVAVAQVLPPSVTERVTRIGADTPDRVWLELTGGARVEWGSAEQTGRKAEVLAALLGQKAKVYDVRAPDAPALRR